MVAAEASALLIGVTDTAAQKYEELPNAAVDVAAMADSLKLHKDKSENFEVFDYVYDKDNNGTSGDLLGAVDLGLMAEKQFLFYFSGHGEMTKYGLQLVTPEKEHPLDTGVYFDTLLHRFNRAEDVEITVILDCCYSGGGGDLSMNVHDIVRPMTQLRDGITILASSERNRKSFIEAPDKPSAFTGEVAKCLDLNSRPNIESVDALDVYKWTREHVKGQTPVLRTFGSTHPVLRAVTHEKSIRPGRPLNPDSAIFQSR